MLHELLQLHLVLFLVWHGFSLLLNLKRISHLTSVTVTSYEHTTHVAMRQRRVLLQYVYIKHVESAAFGTQI